jgi:hypothetical protein
MSGEVVELGSGVTDFKPGDKVISISFPVIYYPHFEFHLLLRYPSIQQRQTYLPSLEEEWRRASRVRGGAGVAHSGTAAGGVRGGRRVSAHGRVHRAAAAQGRGGKQLRRRLRLRLRLWRRQ